MENTLIQILGITAGILTASSFIPQFIQAWKTKEVANLSGFMLITRGTGLALWIVYGVLKSDLPVILTFSFAFIINAGVTVLKIKYSKSK